MNISQVFQRASQVVKNFPYLSDVLLPIDKLAPWSELNPRNYESIHHFAKTMGSALFPSYSPFRGVPHLPYEVPKQGQAIDDREIWFFLNGICTDRSVLRLNGKALAGLFQRKVYLMHNPSDGIVLDLLECIVGRTLQPISTLDHSVAQILEEALNTHRKVILMAHSQGGIIATGALNKLASKLTGSRSRLFKKLEVYTFASAATEFNFPHVYAEHFCHQRDYVARIGVAGNVTQFTGRFFNYDATGHLLNTHYLKNFIDNKFISADGKASQLNKKLSKSYQLGRETPTVMTNTSTIE
ncbi:MAG: hypothetical protein ACI84K_001172 [Pseudohongiellaceae bacterium]|jgi:hypothetical protein